MRNSRRSSKIRMKISRSSMLDIHRAMRARTVNICGASSPAHRCSTWGKYSLPDHVYAGPSKHHPSKETPAKKKKGEEKG